MVRQEFRRPFGPVVSLVSVVVIVFLFDRTETRGPSEKGNDEKVKRNGGRVRTERIDGHNMIQ